MRRRRFLQLTGAALALARLELAQAHADAGLQAGMQASVSTDGLHLRGGPGTDQPSIATLSGGGLVDLLGASADGGWWRVAADAGVGYVSADYLAATGQASTSSVQDVHLDVPYSPQLNAIWCDPADLEMWRDYRHGTAGGPSRSLQSAIWDWETSHNAGFSVDQWDCSPYAVASAAYHWMPETGFDHFVYDDAAQASRTLAWLLAAQQEPSIALIWRGLHYVLVRGVRLDASGVPLGFYVADPDPQADFFLGQDRFIGIDRWLGELFVPVSYTVPHTGVAGDVWQNRVVAVQRSWSGGGPSSEGRRNATPGDYG